MAPKGNKAKGGSAPKAKAPSTEDGPDSGAEPTEPSLPEGFFNIKSNPSPGILICGVLPGTWRTLSASEQRERRLALKPSFPGKLGVGAADVAVDSSKVATEEPDHVPGQFNVM